MSSLKWEDPSEQSTSSKSFVSSSGSLAGNNPWLAVSMGLAGIMIGFVLANTMGHRVTANAIGVPSPVAQVPAPATQPPAAAAANEPAPIDPKRDHIRGDITKAKVAVIDYSDFECPFCKQDFPTLQQISSTYGSQVAIVYRHFPLSFHQNAHKEAEASECVTELGGNDAFWKFHDGIFAKTSSNGLGFALTDLGPLAAQTGVDQQKFQTCLDSGKYAKYVDDQETEGQGAGVTGTPGHFVLNLTTKKSTPLVGAVPFANFKTAIDAALQS